MSRGKDGLTGVQREFLTKVGHTLYEPKSGAETAMAHKMLNNGYIVKISTSRYKLTLAGLSKLGMTTRIDIPPELKQPLEEELKRIMHAWRDCMRNNHDDTSIRTWCCDPRHACRGYDAETFGVLRALHVLGLGRLNRSTHDSADLLTWREGLMEEVLKEENFGGSNECEHCLRVYGKDGAARTR